MTDYIARCCICDYTGAGKWLFTMSPGGTPLFYCEKHHRWADTDTAPRGTTTYLNIDNLRINKDSED